jgi:hypothetical protein
MKHGNCQKIETEYCKKQIYDYCNNEFVNCTERKANDTLLQYCLECESSNDEIKLFNGKCKTIEDIGSDMGCETFDNDSTKSFKERCHCKKDYLLDSVGCVTVTHNCGDFSFENNKCNECLKNHYQWRGKCYSCNNEAINNLCFSLKTDEK